MKGTNSELIAWSDFWGTPHVAIARSLVDNPRIVFADEPTGALNDQTSLAVYNLMREIHQQQKVTFVIVTHERELASKTRVSHN